MELLQKRGRFQTSTAVGNDVDDDSDNKVRQDPGGSVYSKTSGSVAPVTPVVSQTKGSGFTNIQKILKASGTESGPSRLAQTAAGGVRQAAVGAQQALSGATQKFGEETKAKEAELSQLGTGAKNILEQAKTGNLGEGAAQTWQKATSGAYTGPTSLQMTPEQQREAAKSSALSRLAGDTSGRGALLQKYVGSPQYGQSKQTLDTLLLGRGGSSALRGALRQGSRAEQDIRRQEIVAQEQAKQLEQKAKGIAEEAKTGLGQAKTGLMGELETKKQAESERISGAVERVLNALRGITPSVSLVGGGQRGGPSVRGPGEEGVFIPQPSINAAALPTLSRKDLAILGLNEQDVKNLAGAANLHRIMTGTELDVNKYLTGRTSQELKDYLNTLGKEQFAGESEIAKLRALGQLAGQENLGFGDLGSIYTTPGLSNFDISNYKKDFNDAISSFSNSDLTSTLEKYYSDPSFKKSFKDSIKNDSTINLNRFMNEEISEQEFLQSDPLIKDSTQKLVDLGNKTGKENKNGLVYDWDRTRKRHNEIIANRLNQLKNIINKKISFKFTD